MAKGNRNFELILYTQEDCDKAVNVCIKEGFDWAYIKHDKDLKEDLSDFKSLHYHFQIFLPNQKTLERVGELFCIKTNYIQYIKDKRKAIRYLLHADNNDKADYDFLSIRTNMDITNYFNNLISDEAVEIEIIMDFILRNKKVSLIDLYKFVIDNGFWSTYRRNYSIIRDMLYDHNLSFN